MILCRAKRALFRFGSNACTGHMYGNIGQVSCLMSTLIVATIPPSMGLIIYGTVGEVSIGRLFMAGWVPGILMCVLLMLAVTWSARRGAAASMCWRAQEV